MLYKKRDLGIVCADELIRIAEEFTTGDKRESTAQIQKLFQKLFCEKRKVRANMTFLVTHWIYQLSMFAPREEKELWAVSMAKEIFSKPVKLPENRWNSLIKMGTKGKGNTPEVRMKYILGYMTSRKNDAFMKIFWLKLCAAERGKQQKLTEFLLEWVWVDCEKCQAMESIRYRAASYCLPFEEI